MRKRFLNSMAAVSAAVAVLLMLQMPGAGQGPPGGGGKKADKGGAVGGAFAGIGQTATGPAGPPRRLPNGKPDFSGHWTARFGAAVFNVNSSGKKKGPITDPADGMVPYRPEAAQKAQELAATGMYLEPEAHCFMSGVPHQMYVQFGFQFLHTENYLVGLWEFMHSYRIIPTDGRPHTLPDDVHLFQGDSVGRWEGDSLVVDVTNQNDKTWYDLAGNFKTEKIHVVERYTPVDENTIAYEALITDPTIYTRPWKMQGQFVRNVQDGYELMEFACIEGNEDLDHYVETQGGKRKQVRGVE